MSSVRNFCSLSPTMTAAYVFHSCVQTTLPQQLPEPSRPYSNLQPCDKVVAMAEWSMPPHFHNAWLAWDAHQAGPVCPRDILPTLMACGGTPNPTLTWGASSLSQGEFLCSPCA